MPDNQSAVPVSQPVSDRARTRQALVSFSTDVEDTRVLRVRFDRKHDDRDRKAIIEALNAPDSDILAGQSVGDYVLVPREPTGDMLKAAWKLVPAGTGSGIVCGDVYRAMLAATPASDSTVKGESACEHGIGSETLCSQCEANSIEAGSDDTTTDTADRREAIARSVYEEIRSWGDPVEIWDDLHPNDRAFIASLIAGPPEGFVVVPAEPTEAMLAAWATSDKYKDDWRKDCAVGWSAMIAARPTGES